MRIHRQARCPRHARCPPGSSLLDSGPRRHSSAVEQLFRKQQVLGSNPSVGSTLPRVNRADSRIPAPSIADVTPELTPCPLVLEQGAQLPGRPRDSLGLGYPLDKPVPLRRERLWRVEDLERDEFPADPHGEAILTNREAERPAERGQVA